MTGYNPNIEIGVEDMDLIEDALRHAKRRLTMPGGADADAPIAGHTVREIDDLLGRLHNQKVFYRPRKAPYVGG
ncbi:hypothetical protein [Roseovarius nanhaiticus]|uniref:Uncharacterized protein n=1 Tax=Roseovarius nanhaiticus TaxID=573024 RepID=A0A1N7G0G1_9RHOB|nr:hypothetical protein [Roseovarius nanhaiticus]SEK40429.1 hypothetical protein SAMN05216208_0585 [Roseovarius nanhaiticus]SIS06068.1 hypothetical protein SAMN05421666_1551 [Roseovarius nanhaiticus]